MMKLRQFAAWVGTSLFVLFYVHELNPWHPWPPELYLAITGYFGAQALLGVNLVFILTFTVGFLFRSQTPQRWVGDGMVLAFITSVITEMFGVPIALYLVTSRTSNWSIGDVYLERFGHIPVTIGAAINIISLALLLWTWGWLHTRAPGIVFTGPYRFVRHPQISLLLLFTFGWLLHWPTVAGILMWPVLAAALILSAISEERALTRAFGQEYTSYVKRTPFLIPSFLPRRT
ncbi:hypothetical protein CN203_27645 [Sinorhizobium meliloti]|nr:hypothetical protein CN203_27645 [Sinorhizobium meliloti]